VTSFTLAHSITLAAATLGWVNIPQAPVEAVIALSIQFRGVNEVNFGDYTDGFTPSAVDDGEANILGCQVADDLSQQLGNPAENRLEVALAYQAGQGCIAPVGGAAGMESNASDGDIYRSFFDSNRILGRP